MGQLQPKIQTTDSSRLLRRLREVLGGTTNLSTQEKLDRIVKIVAVETYSEVCSIYVRNNENVLILLATEGLNPLAVHLTRMSVGEGVIGDVAANARPLVVSNVKNHPSFLYQAETGEDPLNGFLGVPIFRSGKVLGVIAIQTKNIRLYDACEIELLQTVAMILGEIIVSSDFLPMDQLSQHKQISWLPASLSGLSLNTGIAKGIAIFHQVFPLYSRKAAASIYREKRRLQRGLAEMQASLNTLFSRKELKKESEFQDIFEAYHMLALDRGWQHRLNQAIDQGLSAEASVEKVLNDLKQTMSNTNESFWDARIADLEDISGRLLQFLTGNIHRHPTNLEQENKLILVARMMGPAELLDYEPGSVAGLVLEEGLQSAHVGVVARALEIPVVSGVPGLLLRVEPGDKLIVDGDQGNIIIRPSGKLLDEYENKLSKRKKLLSRIQSVKDQPCETKDGVKISLSINAGLPMDLDRLDELGADGVGLYRTEIPFMLETSLPNVESQKNLYKEILTHAKGKPVIFRTLDIGGDKLLPYLEVPKAENSAMGWRAIRISLDRPALFRHQVRALLQAATEDELYIMAPMVTTALEFKRIKKIIDIEIEWSRKKNIPIANKIKVGAMMEVPSLAYDFKTLLPEIDFLSLGTNDLLQFFYAADRSNVLLTNLYDPISPGFLNFLSEIVKACEKEKVPLQLCGELSSSPLEAMVLLGMGLKSLSMTPSSFGRIKLMVRSLHLENFSQYLSHLIKKEMPNIRHACHAYALDHGIEV